MWVLTAQGFYSVVEHRDDPDRVLIRARAREDIEALRAQVPTIEPFEDRHADYRWRAIVAREEWIAAAALLAAAVDYPNFKQAVAERQGARRASLYGEVCSALRPLQRTTAR